MDDQLPHATLRTLSLVLVAVFDIARDGLADVVQRLRPLVEPPDDMRVASTVGAIYTGVLVIERNSVIAGVVVEVGRIGAPARPAIVTPPPASTPTSHYESRLSRFEQRDEREGRLPGWADDPRDRFRDEDESWRR